MLKARTQRWIEPALAAAAVAFTGCAAPAFGQQRCTPSKLLAPGGAANDSFGSAIAISGDTMVVGSEGDQVGANVSQGSAHVYRWNGSSWAHEAMLTASDGAASDAFGDSVAISGNTIVVGATFNDVGANANQGSVYVFVRNGSSWSQQANLTMSDGAADDQFGFSVAIEGDTVVVGAPRDNHGFNDNGSVCVFTRSGTVWSQQQKLTASDAAAGDQLGQSVAISGDTVVAGAHLDDQTIADQGAGYVFTRSAGVWTQQAKLTAAPVGAAPGAHLGHAVTIDGDTAVLGTYGSNTARALVYTRSAGVWTHEATLNGTIGNFFGSSVKLSGSTLVIGEPNDFPAGGFAYIYTGAGATWTRRVKLIAPDVQPSDAFGFAVGLDRDVAVIGAPGDDIGANSFQGSAWVFSRIGSKWIGPDTTVTAGDAGASDLFGSAVAVSGDYAVVGVPFDDVGAIPDQGSARVFLRSHNGSPALGWVELGPTLVASDGAQNDLFGSSVAIDGDFILVGAKQDQIGGNVNQGSAYIFAVWLLQQAKLVAPDGTDGDSFGHAVAIAGDTAVVTAPLAEVSGMANRGAAYVFVRSGFSWLFQAKLTASDGAASDQFGTSVAIVGDTVVIGAEMDDDPQVNRGSAYVFTRSGTVWTQEAKLSGSDGATQDLFGSAVAISGNTIAIGARGDDSGNGSVYVFTRAGVIWTEQSHLNSPASGGASFGASLGLSGETLVVGAPLEDSNATDQGRAYVYSRAGLLWNIMYTLNEFDESAGNHFGIGAAIDDGTLIVGSHGVSQQQALQGAAYLYDAPPACCPPGINRYYVGANNGNWNTSANWSATPGGAGGVGIPGCGHNAFITGSTGKNVNFNAINSPPGINSLTIDGSSGATQSLTQTTAGTSLAVSGNEYIGITGIGQYLQSTGFNTVGGTVFVGPSGTYTLSGGTLTAGAVANSGVFSVSNNATLDVRGVVSGNGITYTGNVTLTGGTITAPITTSGPSPVISKTTAGTLVINAPQTYAPNSTFECLQGITVFNTSVGSGPANANLTIDANSATVRIHLQAPGPDVTYPQKLAANTPGQIIFEAGAEMVVITQQLQLDIAEARLDITDNALVLDHSDNDGGAGAHAQVSAYVNSGRAGGDYTGTGVLSSVAAASPNNAIGTMNNDQGSVGGTPGTPIYPVFRGANLDASAIIAAYCLHGDSDLDGDVDGTDLNHWITGYQAGLRRGGPSAVWYYGDFDYSEGVEIDSDLYLLARAYYSVHGNVTALLAGIDASSLSAQDKALAKQAICRGVGCRADFNNSCAVTVQDLFDFLTAWFARSPSADINSSGSVTVQDLFDFLSLWFEACNG